MKKVEYNNELLTISQLCDLLNLSRTKCYSALRKIPNCTTDKLIELATPRKKRMFKLNGLPITLDKLALHLGMAPSTVNLQLLAGKKFTQVEVLNV